MCTASIIYVLRVAFDKRRGNKTMTSTHGGFKLEKNER